MPRYVLVLNPMAGQTEGTEALAWSSDRASLVLWMLEQRHVGENGEFKSWTDGRFHKAFKQGSPLEWFNPVDEHAHDAQSDEPYAPNYYGQGIQEQPDMKEYLAGQMQRYDEFFAGITDVGVIVPAEARVAKILMDGEES